MSTLKGMRRCLGRADAWVALMLENAMSIEQTYMLEVNSYATIRNDVSDNGKMC